ncbi:MAG: ComEC/Rec2 family competence protein [Micropepsaceae bacterium]
MPLELFYQANGLFRKAMIAPGSALSSQFKSLTAFIHAGWTADLQRRTLFVPVLLGLGIGIYFSGTTEPPLWTAAAPVPFLMLRYLAAFTNRPSAMDASFAILIVSMGYSLAVARANYASSPSVTEATALTALAGRIIEVEPNSRGGTRLTIAIQATDVASEIAPAQIRLSTSRLRDDLKPGDLVRFEAELKPLPPPVIPGGFDFGRKLWFEGVRGIGFTLRNIETVDGPQRIGPLGALKIAITNLRHDISTRIKSAMSARIGPLAAAFLTGERSAIDEADNQAMRDSSLAHLLSISGLHMVLAGFGFFAAVRYALALLPLTAQRPSTKKLAAACALLVSFAYLVLSGASVPTQRSFVSVAVSFVAIIADRNALNMRTVALGAFAILCITPEAWLDPSFQMSFSAVVALIAMYEWWNTTPHAVAPERGVLGSLIAMLAGAAMTSLVAGLATAPFAAYHFNRMSLYGVAANVMVSPVVSMIIMPTGVLAILLMPFGLEALPLQVMEWGLTLMLNIAHWVASWPVATVSLRAFPIEALYAIALGGLWISIWNAGWRWLGLIAVLTGVMIPIFSTQPDIMISAGAGNIAVRTGTGQFSFLSARKARFDAEMWLRADGDPRELSGALKNKDGGFQCSGSVCVAPVKDGRNWLAFADTQAGLISACSYADIVVTPLLKDVTGCASAKLLLDGQRLQSEGAIAIYVDARGLSWQSVNQVRGKRLWATGSASGP